MKQHKPENPKVYHLNNPLLFTVDNLLPKNLIDELAKEVSELETVRAKVTPNPGETEAQTTFRRTAETAILKYENSKAAQAFLQTSSQMVRLHPSQAEPLSVIKYGIGALYDPHHDTFSSETLKLYTPEAGNRILTCLLYLNDVEEGGETNFPELGITVPAIKNRMLVFSTTHAGTATSLACTKRQSEPVIKGHKMAVNLWYRWGIYDKELFEKMSKQDQET